MEPRRFVSRGGEKLDAALERFAVTVEGRTCLDAGASTGGFTDCLLKRGASRVWAVDVGHGQLAPELRDDPRVVVVERCNLRHATLESLGALPFEVLVADLSFISLTVVAPTLATGLATPGADLVLLVKPQFEAGRAEVGRGRGVIRDPGIWRDAVVRVGNAFASQGAAIMGVMASPFSGRRATSSSSFTLSQRLRPPTSRGSLSSTNALGTWTVVNCTGGDVGPDHGDDRLSRPPRPAGSRQARRKGVRMADGARPSGPRPCGRGNQHRAPRKEPDLAVSLGGDGTMLRAVNLAWAAEIPVLGVNLGRLGYLTEVEPSGLEIALDRFLSGHYALEDRMMLEVAWSGETLLGESPKERPAASR